MNSLENIYLDIGNSNIKYLYSGNVFYVKEIKNIKVDLSLIKFIYLSSVRSSGETRKIIQYFADYSVNVYRPYKKLKNTLNTSYNREQLGEDRGLVIARAIEEKQFPLVVIDAGTAITVDYINKEGVHSGGFILPGIKLAKQSLLGNTNISVQEDEFREIKTIVPNNTNNAIDYYINILAQGILMDIKNKNYNDADILISGGDRVLLSGFFNKPLLVENIVLEALKFFSEKERS